MTPGEKRESDIMSTYRQFQLNVAVIELPPGSGKMPSKEEFSDLISPLRGKIMAHNGMTGCKIERYEITVHFIESIISEDEVAEIVEAAIAAVFEEEGNELFTLAGDTPPVVTRGWKPKEERPPTRCTITVSTNSFLTGFNMKPGEAGWDKEGFALETEIIRTNLVNMDGVLNCEVFGRSANLTVDLRVVSDLDAVEAHMRWVFESAAADLDNLFPFIEPDQLQLTFHREMN